MFDVTILLSSFIVYYLKHPQEIQSRGYVTNSNVYSVVKHLKPKHRLNHGDQPVTLLQY